MVGQRDKHRVEECRLGIRRQSTGEKDKEHRAEIDLPMSSPARSYPCTSMWSWVEDPIDETKGLAAYIESYESGVTVVLSGVSTRREIHLGRGPVAGSRALAIFWVSVSGNSVTSSM